MMENKIIIVTGGTGGLGKCIVEKASNIESAIVISISLNVLKSNKENVEYYSCDISNFNHIDELIKSIVTKYGKIDVLINNAGIIAEGKFVDSSYEQIKKIIDINTSGTMYVTRACLPFMADKKNGYIINIISQGGLNASALKPLYNASKWAITGFTKCLELEALPLGIKVTGIYPGTMKTDIFKKNNIPNDLTRAIKPEDVADLICDLIMKDNSLYIPEISMKYYR